MNGIVLDRARGFTFGGIKVDNTNGVYLLRVERPPSPSLEYFEIVTPGKDGSEVIPSRYENKSITVTIGIHKETITERREVQRKILTEIIGQEGELRFLDEPKLFHLAKSVEMTTCNETEFMTEITIPFVCKPFIYEYPLINSWVAVNKAITVDLFNKGNFVAKPIIKMEGSFNRLQLTIADKAMSLSAYNGTIYVDTENMNVYRIENGVKKSELSKFSGTFLTIPKGLSKFMIAGENLNVKVSLDYKHTYIC